MFLKKLVIIQSLASAILFADFAQAAPLTFNVDGVITNSSNQPLEAANVTFRIDIKDSGESCLLYREDFYVSMTGSNGYFSLVMGKQANQVVGGTTLDKVFSNAAVAIPGESCSYTPASTNETRKIIVSFNDGSTAQIFSTQEIQSVPYALEAAQFSGALRGDVTGSQSATVVSKIQGHPLDLTGLTDGKILKYQSGNFVLADDQVGTIADGSITSMKILDGTIQAADINFAGSNAATTGVVLKDASGKFLDLKCSTTSHVLTWTSVGWSCEPPPATGVTGTASLTSTKIWVGDASGKAGEVTLSGDIASVSNTGVVALKSVGTAGTLGTAQKVVQITTDAQGRVSNMAEVTIDDTTKLPLTGGTLSGNLTVNGNLVMGSNKTMTLSSNAVDPAAPAIGQVWYNSTSNVIKYYDGAVVKTLDTSGAGVQSLGGQSNSTQTLSIGSAGNAPAWTSALGDHKLDIPMASAGATVTAGLISNADYAKIGIVANVVALPNGQMWIGDAGGKAQAQTLGGDAALAADGTLTIGAGKVDSGKILNNSILGGDLDFGGTNNASSSLVIQDSTGKFFNFNCATAGHVATWTVAGWACQAPAPASVTGSATLANTKIWIGNASGKAEEFALSGDVTMDASGAVTIGAGAVGNTKIAAGVDAAKIGGGTVDNIEFGYLNGVTSAIQTQIDGKVAKAGDTMSGDLNMGGNKIVGLTNVPNVAVNPAIGQNGQSLRWNNATSTWEWFTAAASGAGITSLNSQTGNSQSFGAIDLGTTVTAPAWSSATDVHTLKIPMASDTGVTAGLLSKADHTTFSNKLDASSSLDASKLTGTVAIANGGTGASTKTTGFNALSPLTTKGDVLAHDGTNNIRLPAGANGQVLSADSTDPSGLKWATAATGTVTSIATNNGLTGGPITGTGTIGLANIANNTVLANTSGAAGTPVATTVPTLLDTVGNTKGNILYRDGATWTVLAPGTAGQVLQTGGAGANPSWVSTPAAGITDLTGDVTATGPGSAATTIGVGKVTSSHILDGEIVGTDMNFLGFNTASSNIVIKDAGGKFFNFNCATAGHVATWTVAGWACQAPAAASVTGSATLANTQIWIGNASGKAEEFALSGDVTMDAGGAVTIGAGAVGNAEIAAGVDAAKIGSGTVDNIEFGYLNGVTSAIQTQIDGKVAKAGDTMSGDLNMGGNKIVGLTNVPNVAVNPAVGQNGQTLRWNNGTSSWEWFTAAAAGAGITSLNSQTGNSQSFGAIDIGTSVTAPAWSSAADVHTLKIPMASDTGVTAGLLSKADHTTFSNKLDATSSLDATKITGTVAIANGGTGASTKTTGFNALSPLTTKGDVLAHDGTNNIRLPAGANGQILSADATDPSGLKWVAIPSAPVTSVAGKTGAVTLDWGDLGNAAAKYMTYKPNNVACANNETLKFDGVNWVCATLPVLADATTSSKGIMQVGSGLTVSAGTVAADYSTTGTANKLVMLDGTGFANVKGLDIQTGAGKVTLQTSGAFTNYALTLPTSAGTSNQVLTTNGSGLLSWTTPSSSVSLSGLTAATATNTIDSLNFAQAWNWSTASTQSPMSMSANALTTGSILNITTSNNALNSTNGLVRIANTGTSGNGKVLSVQANAIAGSGLYVLANGNVGIGTTNPGSSLEVLGNGLGGNDITIKGPSSDIGLQLYNTGTGGRVYSIESSNNGSSQGGGNFTIWDETAVQPRLTINGTGNVGIGTALPTTKLDVAGSVRVGTDGSACAAGLTGAIRYNTGNIEYCNGTTWATPSGADATKLPLAGGTMTGAIAMGGNNITGGGTITGTVLTGTTSVNSPSFNINATSPGTGLLSMKYVNTATNTTLIWPAGNPTAGYVLTNNGTGGLSWTAPTSSSVPTATSGYVWIGQGAGNSAAVAMSGDATITNTGTLTLNTVSVGKGGTGATTLAAGSLLVGNGTTAVNTLAGGTTGNVLYASSASTWASGTPDAAGLVDKTSAQIISGAKTFTGTVSTGRVTSNSQIVPGFITSTTSALDFNNGNTITTSGACPITLSNMVDGGNYTVIVTNTGTSQCDFTHTGITTWKFMPANTTRMASSHTVYSMLKAGSTVYVWWTTGF